MNSTLDRAKAPLINPIDRIIFPSPVIRKLSNDISVVGFNIGTQEVVHIQLVFDAGTKRQSKNLQANYTNKLIGEVSQNYSQGQIINQIDYFGAFFEHGVTKDGAFLSLFTPTKYISKVLPLFAEAILHPKFDAEMEVIFNTHLKNGKNKQKIALEKVATIAKNEFFHLLFNNHPYGGKVDLTDYDNIALSEVEQFYNQFYTADKCTIFISGKYDANLVNELDAVFGKMKVSQTNEPVDILKESTPAKVHIEKQDAIQSGIQIGKVIDVEFGTQDYFDLKIANVVLGGYFGSRLMSNIREDKGYTYGISSGIGALEKAVYFVIATEVGADVTQPALTEIYKELQALNDEPIAEEELAMVKNYMLGSILKASDGPFSIEELYKSIYFKGKTLDFYNGYVNRINEITPKDIQNIFQKYLNPESMLEVVAGKANFDL